MLLQHGRVAQGLRTIAGGICIGVTACYAGTFENLINQPRPGLYSQPTPAPVPDLTYKISKQEFFEKASKQADWWGAWQDRYIWSSNVQFILQAQTIRLISQSSIIRYILEDDYGVSVPFDLTNTSVLNGYFNSMGTPPTPEMRATFCKAKTTVDLASGLSAVTVAIAPELVFPHEEYPQVVPSVAKDSATHYLQDQILTMQKLCGESYPAFVNAYKQFLSDYSEVINSRYVSERDAQQKISEAKQLAEKQHDLERERAEEAAVSEKVKQERREQAKIKADLAKKAEEERIRTEAKKTDIWQ